MAKTKVTLRVNRETWAEIGEIAAAQRRPQHTVAASLMEEQVSLRRIENQLADVQIRLVHLQLLFAEQVPKERHEALRQRAKSYVDGLAKRVGV